MNKHQITKFIFVFLILFGSMGIFSKTMAMDPEELEKYNGAVREIYPGVRHTWTKSQGPLKIERGKERNVWWECFRCKKPAETTEYQVSPPHKDFCKQATEAVLNHINSELSPEARSFIGTQLVVDLEKLLGWEQVYPELMARAHVAKEEDKWITLAMKDSRHLVSANSVLSEPYPKGNTVSALKHAIFILQGRLRAIEVSSSTSQSSSS